MRLSDREITNSLRLLSEPPIGSEGCVAVDPQLKRLVLDYIKETPEVREGLIRPLKEAVKKHRYAVSCEEVAYMMLGRLVADLLR